LLKGKEIKIKDMENSFVFSFHSSVFCHGKYTDRESKHKDESHRNNRKKKELCAKQADFHSLQNSAQL